MRSDFTQTELDATSWVKHTRRSLSVSRHWKFIAHKMVVDIKQHTIGMRLLRGFKSMKDDRNSRKISEGIRRC
jgi:hypothetical protein